MRCPRFALLGMVLLASCASKPSTPPPSTDLDDTLYRDAVRELSSDAFEGRRPGTPGGDKTVAYIAERFRRLGLKPGNGAGKNASFLQTVPLLEIDPDPGITVSVSSQAGTRQLQADTDVLVWSRQAMPDVQLQRSDLVFVGYGTVAPEYSWNDYNGIDVRGKTVIVLAGDPGVGSKDPSIFRGDTLSVYGRWQYKIEEAARHGAGGVLLIHDAALLGFGWDTLRASFGGPRFALAGADAGGERAKIEGWLQLDAARNLFGAAGLDYSAATAAAAHAGFKALVINAKLDVGLHHTLRAFESQNVVALLPGDKRRDEYVLYTAHWDSLGADARQAAHATYSGAVDNASGVAGLLALAQSFTRTKPAPDRSIVFLATTAGDPDFCGSTYYTENAALPLRRTAAVIDVDGLLPGGHARDLAIFGFGSTDMEETARAVALLQGRETHADPFPELGLFLRSDSYVFAHHGVPVLLVQSGLDDAARGPAYGKARREEFLAHRYHLPADKYSSDWNVVGAIDDLSLYYEVGMRVARNRRFPRWTASSEFRAARQHPGEAEAAD